MALPFQDSFTDSPTTQLHTHNAVWVMYSSSAIQVGSTNKAEGLSGTSLGATASCNTSPALNANQYAQCHFVSAGGYPGLWVHFQVSTETGYLLIYNGDVYKVVNGVLGSTIGNCGAFTSSDLAYIQAIESGSTVTLSFQKNGAAQGSPIVDSSSAILGGTSGIFFYAGTGGTIDDFETGNATGAGGGSNWGALLSESFNRLIQG